MGGVGGLVEGVRLVVYPVVLRDGAVLVVDPPVLLVAPGPAGAQLGAHRAGAEGAGAGVGPRAGAREPRGGVGEGGIEPSAVRGWGVIWAGGGPRLLLNGDLGGAKGWQFSFSRPAGK